MISADPAGEPITVPAAGLFKWVALAAGLIIALGWLREVSAVFLGQPSDQFMVKVLWMDGELCVPAWFASVLMAAIGGLMLLTAQAERRALLSTARAWRLLGYVFFYLSLDEMVTLHEKYEWAAQAFPALGNLFHFKWLVTGIFATGIVFVALLPFLRNLPRPTAIRLFTSGAVFIAGAIGMEIISGLYVAQSGKTTLYYFAACLEETLEILGLVLAFRTLLLHLAEVLPAASFRFTRQPLAAAQAA